MRVSEPWREEGSDKGSKRIRDVGRKMIESPSTPLSVSKIRTCKRLCSSYRLLNETGFILRPFVLVL